MSEGSNVAPGSGSGVGSSVDIPVGAPPSDRSDLWWLNWTTVRGAALVLAGVVVVSTPDERRILGGVVAFVLVGWAMSELWFALRDGRAGTGMRRALPTLAKALLGLVLVTAAVLLFIDQLSLTVVIGILILLRSMTMFWRAAMAGAGNRRDPLVSAVSLAVVGVVVIAVPDTAVLALRAGLGVGAMALGGVMLNLGLRRDGRPQEEKPRVPFDHSTAPALVNQWLIRRRLPPESRLPLEETLYFEAPNKAAKLASFWVMMVLATGIATFAVIQDSTAVVIGAMLVAPLMTPIMGVAAAAVNGWPARLARSVLLVLVAAAAAVFVAWLIASWLPSVGQIVNNTQISSRVEPSLLDFCIAVFAGSAGAYASIDPRVSSSLSGVAIAVALVPPLSVVGITLQQGDYEMAFGATLLFSTNVVSIVLAAVTVFVLTGFAELPPSEDQRVQLRRVISVFGAGALIILVPLSVTSQELWAEAFDAAEVEEAVGDWLPDDGSVELVDVETEGEEIEIVITGPAIPEDTGKLSRDIEERLGFGSNLRIRLVASSVTELD